MLRTTLITVLLALALMATPAQASTERPPRDVEAATLEFVRALSFDSTGTIRCHRPAGRRSWRCAVAQTFYARGYPADPQRLTYRLEVVRRGSRTCASQPRSTARRCVRR